MDSFVNGARMSIEIPNAWYAANTAPNAKFDVMREAKNQGKGGFIPRGIVFDRRDGDPVDTPSATAKICGILFDDNNATTRTLACNVEHPRAYSIIYPNRSSARGIEINA